MTIFQTKVVQKFKTRFAFRNSVSKILPFMR